MTNTIKKKRTETIKPKPKGHDLMIAITFLAYGLMFYYFPIYAGIPEPWSWIFIIIAYFWYLTSMSGAVTGLSNLTNSEFIKNTGFGLVCGIIAVFLHNWSENIGALFLIVIVLKIVALLFAMLCVGGIAIGIPYLWNKDTTELVGIENDENSKNKKQPTKGRFEVIASITVSLLYCSSSNYSSH